VLISACTAMLAGCPQTPSDGSTSGVTAVIGVSSTRGEPPLMISVTGADSTSSNGVITGFAWDFAGQAVADTVNATHTFTAPGRYSVTLTVTDETGAQDSTKVDVQVSGPDATAVIETNRTSGAAPLTVSFNASSSSATNDTVRDYFWDFGDGSTSRNIDPIHTYTRSGEFIASLRVVSAGGVEDTAEVTINVSASAGPSLQFNGSQFANLPVSGGTGLSAFTLEAWVKPDNNGGGVATLGSPGVAVELLPATNTLRVRLGTESYQGSAFNANNRWQHLAVVYVAATVDPNDPTGEPARGSVTAYLSGVPVVTGEAIANVSISAVTLAGGFSGSITRVKLWSTARTAAEVAADADAAASGAEQGLLGGWAISEGRGQTLANVKGGSPGTLGATSDEESTDPAWSNDGP
jgi:PKD repeat protein